MKYECPKGYVQVTDLEVLHKLLENLFWKFHCFCEENNLLYNIESGTLLGAVRHKGFIPWDDDIDLNMPRPDYERLIRLFKEKQPAGMTVHSYPEKNYFRHWMRIGMPGTISFDPSVRDQWCREELTISVFPVDGCPDDAIEREKYFEGNVRLRALSLLSVQKLTLRKFWRKPTLLFTMLWRRFWGYEKCLDEKIKLMKKYSYEDNELLIVGTTRDKRKNHVLPKKLYCDRIKYDFQGYKVWGIRNYDYVLRRIYGDYMVLPAKEDQIPSHGKIIYVDREILDGIVSSK